MASYILAHDLGTTGNKASLFNEKGQLVSSCYREYKTYYPGPRMIEQDPHDWLNAIKESTRIVLEKSNAKVSEIVAIGLSTHQLGCIPMTARGELRQFPNIIGIPSQELGLGQRIILFSKFSGLDTMNQKSMRKRICS